MDEETLQQAGNHGLENSNAISEPNLHNYSENDQERLGEDQGKTQSNLDKGSELEGLSLVEHEDSDKFKIKEDLSGEHNLTTIIIQNESMQEESLSPASSGKKA